MSKNNGKTNGKAQTSDRPGGTWVNENSEVIRFSDLPSNMKFSIDHKGKVWAHFTDPQDGRKLPFEHEVVQAYLYAVLMKGKHRAPEKGELFSYRQRCLASALLEFRERQDPRELLLERETVIQGILIKLFDSTERDSMKFWKVSPKDARDALLELAKKKDWDTSDWAAGNHFTEYLDDRRKMLEEHNVRFTWGKKNGNRYFMFEWIDQSKIPPFENDVG